MADLALRAAPEGGRVLTALGRSCALLDRLRTAWRTHRARRRARDAERERLRRALPWMAASGALRCQPYVTPRRRRR